MDAHDAEVGDLGDLFAWRPGDEDVGGLEIAVDEPSGSAVRCRSSAPTAAARDRSSPDFTKPMSWSKPGVPSAARLSAQRARSSSVGAAASFWAAYFARRTDALNPAHVPPPASTAKSISAARR
ncbi:MAG: hypothetical protein ABI175_01845, partial [Polyangiales bacterium]